MDTATPVEEQTARPATAAGLHDRLGGCVSGDVLAGWMASTCPQSISRVARMLVTRQVVHYGTDSNALIPLFQFEPNYIVRAAVRSVLDELTPAMDDQEIAEWFATPNEWLGLQVPAVLALRGDPAIVHAARATRFVSRWV